MPDEQHSVVVELFARALTGLHTCGELATWLNRLGYRTRNFKRTDEEKKAGNGAQPRRFTADTVQGILTNPFYAGSVVKQRRKKNGTATTKELKAGMYVPAVAPDDFQRIQSALRARHKAPRSHTRKLGIYVGNGLLRCSVCGEKAWCSLSKAYACYRESSADRGIACDRVGKVWPMDVIDSQLDRLIEPLLVPAAWRERALEIARSENGLLDLQDKRNRLQIRRARVVRLFKDGEIDRAEYDRDLKAIENQLRVLMPGDVQFLELTMADFERLSDTWPFATPEEKRDILRCMLDSVYIEFRTGQITEVVPKDSFRFMLEAAEITKLPDMKPGGSEFVVGDPEGDRGVPAQTRLVTHCVARNA